VSAEISHELLVMEGNHPVAFDRGTPHTQFVSHPVMIEVSIGNGLGTGQAWGCDLSYEYVKINAEYTT
ncbi:MAG: bifunctional ornithine acetyltransferase/N-acetylglutamate synthase, partial [Phormidesmis sp. CAN_BIN44]|nr:bifunctional ornithine acetyltransferase/N-acetylglutamate synthase [Phormidesmis sp. CAN_BIN44]